MNARYSAALVAILAASAPAQNLLTWNGWQPWNAPLVTNLNVTPTSITFAPFKPGPLGSEVCGIEQTVNVPTAGTYQLHFQGGGGGTGLFVGSWAIQGQQGGPFPSFERLQTWTFHLAPGSCTLRFQTTVSNIPSDSWGMAQPVLEPATEPTADVNLESSAQPRAEMFAQGEYVVLGLKTWAPLHIPGISGTLNIDPIIVFAAPVEFDPSKLIGVTWPAFYLQALSLTPSPQLGSVLAAQPFRF